MTAGPHTEGVLHVLAERGKWGGLTTDNVHHVFTAHGFRAEANAKRLAAAWNTCNSLTLEQVERLGKLLAAYNGDEVEQMLTESGV